MLQQYKSSVSRSDGRSRVEADAPDQQILKRMLKVNQPMLQLQVLKLIKSQMPWCGRKWRHGMFLEVRGVVVKRADSRIGNMKTITSIYLNCRPELRDEWLSGTDLETELEDALVSALSAEAAD